MLGVALALRLVVLALTWSHASAPWFFGQASELGMLAASLSSGRGFSGPFGGLTGPSAFLAPGYPALVAGVFDVFHAFSLACAVAITGLQALFAAATTVTVTLVGQRVLGMRAANAAGAVWALSPALLWVPTMFWETSLSTLLLTGLVLLALVCVDGGGKVWWAGFGALGALALVVNSSLLTVVMCCLGWAAWRARARLSGPALGAAVLLVLSSFWPARNLRVMHAWIPLRSNMGYELWQGNRPGADGFFLVDLHPNTSAAERHRWEELGEVGYMREKSALAKAAILADPQRFAELTLKRIACFWTGVNRSISWIVVTHITITSGFGIWGAVLLLRRRVPGAMLLVLPLLLFPLPYYVTHPDFRFRLVLDPVLILLGAYAATECLRSLRRGRRV